GTGLGKGLPRPDLPNLVFAPHYYHPVQFVTGIYDGSIDAIREGLSAWADKASSFGVPLLLSEYGFRGYTEEGNPEVYLPDHYRVMDELLLHGTIWSHEITSTYWNNEDCAFVDGTWEERPDMADPLARPYPRFTSGAPVAFTYDPLDRSVEYRYVAEETCAAPTVLALPRRHYPAAPAVTLAFGTWEHVPETGELQVFDGPGAAGSEQVVRVDP
ncbi:MAG: cellulase family glycosylhydrolase, partial [Deltaproteobacteria bacterium]|nr:cellulase family glycosylhydrolase [Deltaproteobacteria bacterium]